MDVTTSNLIYDELAATIGMRLIDIGMTLNAEQVVTLSTDREREAGVEHACALGRLALDSDDMQAIRNAVEAQDDRIRSILALPVGEGSSLAMIHQRDLADARNRRNLIDAYLRNDTTAMLLSHRAIKAG